MRQYLLSSLIIVMMLAAGCSGIDFTSIDDLMGKDVSQRCIVGDDYIVYTAKDKYRIEPVNGTEDNTLYDGEKLYVWNYKNYEGSVAETKEDMEKLTPTLELDKNYRMRCKSWNRDEFKPPTNIKFQAMANMIQDLKQQAEQIGEDFEHYLDEDEQCSSCDLALSEEDKIECRKSLGCPAK